MEEKTSGSKGKFLEVFIWQSEAEEAVENS